MTDSLLDHIPPLSLATCKDVAWESYGRIFIDNQGKIIVVNNRAELIFKTIPGWLIGKKIEELLPPEIAESHVELRDTYIDNPLIKNMNFAREVKGLRTDGAHIRVIVALWPFVISGNLYVMASVQELGIDHSPVTY